jgi:hypothetical protein
MSVYEMSLGEMSVNEMSIDEITRSLENVEIESQAKVDKL